MEVASHPCLALFGAIFEKFSVQDSLLAPVFPIKLTSRRTSLLPNNGVSLLSCSCLTMRLFCHLSIRSGLGYRVLVSLL